MTTKNDDNLSALVDGELDSTRAKHLITDITASDELRARWANYHVISDAMQGNGQHNQTIDLSAQISAALEDEPTVLAPRSRTRTIPAMFKQVAGMAVAATVAAAAVLMLQPTEPGVFNQTEMVAGLGSPVGQLKEERIRVNNSGMNWSATQPSVASRLNGYLVNHNGYSTAVRGNLPFASIVGYDESAISTDADDAVILEYNPNGNSTRR